MQEPPKDALVEHKKLSEVDENVTEKSPRDLHGFKVIRY